MRAVWPFIPTMVKPPCRLGHHAGNAVERKSGRIVRGEHRDLRVRVTRVRVLS